MISLIGPRKLTNYILSCWSLVHCAS